MLMLTGIALCYLYIALTYWQLGRIGLCLAFVAYAVSNIGFVVDLWQR